MVLQEAGNNAFTLSPQRWAEETNAIGIVSKSGRYGGTFAHPDIAMEFASWISTEFKLYLIQDYQTLSIYPYFFSQLLKYLLFGKISFAKIVRGGGYNSLNK